MDENLELVRDYKDCIDYLRKIDEHDYEWLSNWAMITCEKWLSKDKSYLCSVTLGQVPPQNNRERATNSLTNLKTTLEKIAVVKGFQF